MCLKGKIKRILPNVEAASPNQNIFVIRLLFFVYDKRKICCKAGFQRHQKAELLPANTDLSLILQLKVLRL
jgi:hypothetical protein